MTRQPRILLVDDNRGLANDYSNALALRGHRVDVCYDQESAAALIQTRIYDVALVDINLSGDPRDRSGGLSLIKYIKETGDGTAIIVVSADESPQFSADLLQVLHVHWFVHKHDITTKGVLVLLDAVDHALNNVKLALLGKCLTITQVICGTPDQVCVDTLLRRLEPTNRHRGLEQFLTKLLDSFLPLLPPAGAEPPWLASEQQHAVFRGRFWSKGVGSAIRLAIAKHDSGDIEMSTKGGGYHYEAAGVVGIIDLIEEDRSAYLGH